MIEVLKHGEWRESLESEKVGVDFWYTNINNGWGRISNRIREFIRRTYTLQNPH